MNQALSEHSVTILVAAVHLPGTVTIPLAVVLVAWICWYWVRLGGIAVPASRRWLRRASLLVMLAGTPALLRAVSFVDPAIEPREYARMWTFVVLALVLLVIVAVADACNSLRLHARDVMRMSIGSREDAASRGDGGALRRVRGDDP